MLTKKQRLAEKLIEERELFKKRGQNVEEHNVTINYLMFDETTENPNDWELLDAAMYDFDTLCSDYGVSDLNNKADAEFQSKKEAAKENSDLVYDLYRSYVGSAETQEERLRRIQMFRRG
jgi:hypothetical protein